MAHSRLHVIKILSRGLGTAGRQRPLILRRACSSCVTDPVEEACLVSDCIEKPTVVVVGAGIAGLTAAARLVQCGITDVTVLEAKPISGGRIKSCTVGSTVLEMGAPWITGASVANSAYRLAASEGLIKDRTRVTHDRGLYFTTEGRVLSIELTEKMHSVFRNMVNRACGLHIEAASDNCQSMSDFLDEQIMAALEKLPEIERYDAARLLYGMANAHRVRLGDDLAAISTRKLGLRSRLPGGNLPVPGGLAKILEPLEKLIKKESIVHNRQVKCVRWGTAGQIGPRAVVKCEEGEEYPADYVLITVSLGVLKNLSEKMFCPALPLFKSDAIKNLGFGHVNRLYLQYERPFWTGSDGGVQLAWSPDDLSPRDIWVKGVSGFTGVEGTKILCATLAGQEAKAMEQCCDEEVTTEVTHLLRKFLGDRCLPRPDKIFKSKWSTDPCFFGAFTYLGHDSTIEDICALASPLPVLPRCPDASLPILLFAGEHTHTDHFATVHGAAASGLREADRIIDITKRIGLPVVKKIDVAVSSRA